MLRQLVLGNRPWGRHECRSIGGWLTGYPATMSLLTGYPATMSPAGSDTTTPIDSIHAMASATACSVPAMSQTIQPEWSWIAARRMFGTTSKRLTISEMTGSVAGPGGKLSWTCRLVSVTVHPSW